MARYILFAAACVLLLQQAAAQCPQGYIPDCNGNCFPASWIGDGVCDDGVQYESDFMCAEFNWDNGDCGDCPPGMVIDCNGNCWSASFIGNGVCNNGALGGPNYNCDVYDYDGGDCPIPGCTDPMATNYDPVATSNDGSCYYTPCPPGEFEDCNGTCWPDAMLVYLQDWHCHGGFWVTNQTYFDLGPTGLDFNCELFNFDGGDCLVYGCTDPAAANYYEHATTDDGSCFYGTCPPGTMDCMGNCVPENWLGQNLCDGISDDPQSHLFYGAYPDHLVNTISVGSTPRGMCVLPDGSKAYIGCQTGVSVVNLNDDGICSSTNIITNGIINTCSASLDGTKVFASNYSTNVVHVINTANNVIIANIPVGNKPIKMWTSNNGQFVYVSCNFANQVYMINATTHAVVHVFNTGVQPRNICTSPDDTRLYVADWLSFTMSVFSTLPPYELIATVPVDYWPQAIWATPDGKYVLVANFGFDLSYDHISVIRTTDWQVIARLQTGAGPEDMVGIGEDGQYLYVSNWGQSCCFSTAYDFCCSTTAHEGSVSIIALPDFDAIVPPGTIPDTIPYINATLTTVPLGDQYSFGMATHPSGNFVYTVNMNSATMSVIGFDENSWGTAGETCDDPIILESLTECIEGTTAAFHDDYNETCPYTDTGGKDIVFSYTPAMTVTGSINLCSSCFDTKIYIYEDDCGTGNGGTPIYCNDDFCGVNGWRSYLSGVTFNPSHTYYIVVDGYGETDQGRFSMCFEMSCPSDLNQDGMINTSDLLLLISGYGTQYTTTSLFQFLADFGQVCAP